MSFGNHLREERIRRHLSQEELAEALGLSVRSIRRWERGQSLPQAFARLQLRRFFGLPSEALFEEHEIQTPFTPLWCVPYPRNLFFTGREAILTTLHTSLCTQQKAPYTHVYALNGLGGVGKTQIALEYAYRFAQAYHAVFWIRAETAESFALSLMRLAEMLQLVERDDKEQQRIIEAVNNWLMTHDQWLLICDNVEDLGILDRFLPTIRHGVILLTTRLQVLGTRARSIPLWPMEQEEGMLFLLRRARVFEADTTAEDVRQLAERQPSHYAATAELVTIMGSLPLALDQAGAYLEETRCGLSTYLELFRTRRIALLQQRGEGGGHQDHPLSVAATFALVIIAAAERHPAVQDFLRVCALLQPDAIPEELFLKGGRQLGTALEAVCSNPLHWNQVAALACSSSLLSRQPETQTFSIHRLVQAVLLDTMTESEWQEWTQRVIGALDAVFSEKQPAEEYTSWQKQCERLVTHALLSLQRAEAAECSLTLASLGYKVAQYLHQRGRYAEAESLYQRALQIQEQMLGVEDPQIVNTLTRLAFLFRDQGQYEKAESLYQRALHIQERSLGENTTQMATTLNDLALLYSSQGRYVEAEPLLQRALHIYEQERLQDPLTDRGQIHKLSNRLSLPTGFRQEEYNSEKTNTASNVALEEHTLPMATVLNNLALLYWQLGRYAEAEPFYQRTLRIREQVLGLDHPDVGAPLNHLGLLYHSLGRYTEAEPLYQRAVRIWEQTIGPEHRTITYAFNNLAELYRVQGRYAEAESLYQRALHIRERHLGSEHAEVATLLNNLANLYRLQHKDTEAESFYRRALSIHEQVLGSSHHLVAESLAGLANLFRDQGEYTKAEPLYQRAMLIQEQHLGQSHPKMAQILHDMAIFAQKRGDLSAARPLAEQALKLRLQFLGDKHPKTKETQMLYDQFGQVQVHTGRDDR